MQVVNSLGIFHPKRAVGNKHFNFVLDLLHLRITLTILFIVLLDYDNIRNAIENSKGMILLLGSIMKFPKVYLGGLFIGGLAEGRGECHLNIFVYT